MDSIISPNKNAIGPKGIKILVVSEFFNKIFLPIVSFRIFWTAICCLSGYYTWMYLIATWYAFQNNAVSFVMETDYLEWNTTFPAVSICEQESPDKLFDVANE